MTHAGRAEHRPPGRGWSRPAAPIGDRHALSTVAFYRLVAGPDRPRALASAPLDGPHGDGSPARLEDGSRVHRRAPKARDRQRSASAPPDGGHPRPVGPCAHAARGRSERRETARPSPLAPLQPNQAPPTPRNMMLLLAAASPRHPPPPRPR